MMTEEVTKQSVDNKENSSRKISRRSVLASVGSAVTISSTPSVVTAFSSESTVDLPQFISGDEIVDWITVPQSWNDHRMYAQEVLEKNRERFTSHPGVQSVKMIRDEEKTFGTKYNGAKIKVITSPTVSAQSGVSDLPSEVRDIKVDVSTAPANSFKKGECTNITDKQKENCLFTKDFNKNTKVKGGEALYIPDIPKRGTACGRVHRDGTEYMLTCAHIFWDTGSCDRSLDLSDMEVQSSSGQKIGEVEDFDVAGDYALIREEEDGEWNRQVNARLGHDDNPRIEGYVSEEALIAWSLLANSPCVYNMGTTTGMTTGRVYAFSESLTGTCTNLRDAGVNTYCDFGEGDSGGPTYALHQGDAYMISVTSIFYPATNYYTLCDGNKVGSDSSGIAAHWLVENEDVEFQQQKVLEP